MKFHFVANGWLVTACGTDTQDNPRTQVTGDTAKVTCLRCPKAKCYPAAQVDTQTAVTDLYERALTLGYTGDSAATLADCFTNHNMISDPCPTHPNHSVSVDDQGYAVDGCQACRVIVLSDNLGYFPGMWAGILAKREVEYVKIMEGQITQAYAAGECACGLILDMGAKRLPVGGRVCLGCGSVFTPEGGQASEAILAESGAIVAAKLAFDESDPSTWSKLPAGYHWVAVEALGGEENLMSPDGRNVSAAFEAALRPPYVTALGASHDGPDYPGDVAVAVRTVRADILVAMHRAGIDTDSSQAHTLLITAYRRALQGGRGDLGLADRYRDAAMVLIVDESQVAAQAKRQAAERADIAAGEDRGQGGFCDDGKCGTCADCVECAQVTEDPKGFDEAMAEAERDELTGIDILRELLTLDPPKRNRR